LEDYPLAQLDISLLLQEIKLGETPLLAAKALAIAPGTWKSFTFSLDVIHDAIGLYEGVPIVEHHTFNEPMDVKGWIFSQETTKEGIDASFYVHDPDSMEKLASGKLNSVSSNFLLSVDDDDVVEEIHKVVELTLTDNPACKPCLIMALEEVTLDDNEQPPIAEGSIGERKTMSQEDNKASIKLEEDNAALRVQLEEVNAKLEQNSAQLKEKDQMLEEKEKSQAKLSERIDKLEADRIGFQAEMKLKQFEDENKVSAANRDAALKILQSDQATSFEQFLSKAQVVELEVEQGFTTQDNPNEPINGTELEDAITENLQEAFRQQKHGVPYAYGTGSGGDQ